MLKRFVIFAGQEDDSRTGWNSILRNRGGKIVSFDTIEEAQKDLPKTNGFPYDWAHITDLQTGLIVE